MRNVVMLQGAVKETPVEATLVRGVPFAIPPDHAIFCLERFPRVVVVVVVVVLAAAAAVGGAEVAHHWFEEFFRRFRSLGAVFGPRGRPKRIGGEKLRRRDPGMGPGADFERICPHPPPLDGFFGGPSNADPLAAPNRTLTWSSMSRIRTRGPLRADPSILASLEVMLGRLGAIMCRPGGIP